MRLVLNTTRIGNPEAATMDVQIAYLKSYMHMGMVVARCASGCSCEDLKINGHHDSHTSTVFLVQLRPSQADRCVIELEVLQESKSKDQEHKFKVTGVMVGGDWDMVSRLHASCLGCRSVVCECDWACLCKQVLLRVSEGNL